jgi:guanyl-specific ribonuclease Sa
MAYSTTSKYIINGRTYLGTSSIVQRAFEQGTVTGDIITEIKPDGTKVEYKRSGNTFVANTPTKTTSTTTSTAPSGATSVQVGMTGIPKTTTQSTTTKSTSTQPALTAQQLVDKALMENKTTNLQQYDWWNSNTNKSTAWSMLQEIISSPQKMAEYVKSKGLTNLSQYSWWSSSPYKQDAWNIINGVSTTPSQQNQLTFGDNLSKALNDFQKPALGQTTGGATQAKVGTTGLPEGFLSSSDAAKQASDLEKEKAKKLQEALDLIDKSDLPPELKALYKTVARGWDYDKEVNPQAILDEFKRIQTQTIDPYFRELTTGVVRDIEDSIQFQEEQRARELQSERFNAGEDIRQAKAGLEKAGMTFTGQGIEELGAQSAFAREGGTAIPQQQTFGGAYFEGNVPMRNRLLASSSEARYNENLQALGREAEKMLGSEQTALLNIPGYGVTPGGVVGSLERQQNEALGNTLSSLAATGQLEQAQSQNIASKYNLPALNF